MVIWDRWDLRMMADELNINKETIHQIPHEIYWRGRCVHSLPHKDSWMCRSNGDWHHAKASSRLVETIPIFLRKPRRPNRMLFLWRPLQTIFKSFLNNSTNVFKLTENDLNSNKTIFVSLHFLLLSSQQSWNFTARPCKIECYISEKC
jgi:hypothetical protein